MSYILLSYAYATESFINILRLWDSFLVSKVIIVLLSIDNFRRIAMKKALLTGFAALSTMFAVAQSDGATTPTYASNDDNVVLAENTGSEHEDNASTKAKFKESVETVTKEDPHHTPAVRSGTAYEAMGNSRNNDNITIFISSGTKDTYNRKAEYYADMYVKLFADSTRTDNPVQVEVLFEDSDLERNTAVGFYIDGLQWTNDANKSIFSPKQGLLEIDDIADYLASIRKTMENRAELTPNR